MKDQISSGLDEIEFPEKIVKKSNIAGTFYPKTRGNLEAVLDELLNYAGKDNDNFSTNGSIRAIIAPHAGYMYSGEVAAKAYSILINQTYDTVIILGPSHNVYFMEASILNASHYETPLGEAELHPKLLTMIEEQEIFSSEQSPHDKEHSVEVHIPFIQKVLPEARIIPIVVGDVNIDELSEAIGKYIDDETLIIASSDLSHYYPYDTANMIDDYCIKNILAMDIEACYGCEACGLKPIMALLKIAEQNSWEPVLLDHMNSGDVTGDINAVVGYASFVFVGPKKDNSKKQDIDEIKGDDRKFLIRLARNTIRSALDDTMPESPDEENISDILKEKRGCFVTLEKDGNLRGCIGSIMPHAKLYECVMSNAVNAALSDMRFDPLTEDELDEVKIQISKLTLPEVIEYESEEELLEKIEQGVDGVILRRGWKEATYLPTVWETIPDKKLFLTSLCQKGGFESTCWKSENIIVKTYAAETWIE
ncbi:MAG: AmmeMemoRadiSam system protein B [Candidatus Woesearchaeota archaeon]